MAQEELRLQLASVLSGGADSCDRCVGVLATVVQGHPAVTEAHAERTDGPGDHLLIRFDNARAPATELHAFARSSGSVIAQRFGHLTFRVGGAIHPRTARRIAEHLRAQRGVIRAEVHPAGRALVEFDRLENDEETLLAGVRVLGVDLDTQVEQPLITKAITRPDEPSRQPHRHDSGAEHHGHSDKEHRHGQGGSDGKHEHGHGHAHAGIFGERTELIFALLAGAALAAGWLIERRAAGLVPLAFYIAAYVDRKSVV